MMGSDWGLSRTRGILANESNDHKYALRVSYSVSGVPGPGWQHTLKPITHRAFDCNFAEGKLSVYAWMVGSLEEKATSKMTCIFCTVQAC